MFVFTTKINKRKIFIGLLLITVVVAAIITIVSSNSGDRSAAASLEAVVKTNEQRVAYLKSLGWDVSENAVEQQTVLIPKSFSQTYADYNKIQEQQGFELKDYGGMEAVRYTYEILNHPSGSDGVVADILVYRDRVIGGDVQSTSLNGFMSGLEYPEKVQ